MAGQKVWNLASIFDTAWLWAVLLSKRSNASLPQFRILCRDDAALFTPNLVQFENQPPWKKTFAKSSITQPRIVRLRSNSYSLLSLFCISSALLSLRAFAVCNNTLVSRTTTCTCTTHCRQQTASELQRLHGEWDCRLSCTTVFSSCTI